MGLSIVAYFVSIIFINSFWELDYNLYQVLYPYNIMNYYVYTY